MGFCHNTPKLGDVRLGNVLTWHLKLFESTHTHLSYLDIMRVISLRRFAPGKFLLRVSFWFQNFKCQYLLLFLILTMNRRPKSPVKKKVKRMRKSQSCQIDEGFYSQTQFAGLFPVSPRFPKMVASVWLVLSSERFEISGRDSFIPGTKYATFYEFPGLLLRKWSPNFPSVYIYLFLFFCYR